MSPLPLDPAFPEALLTGIPLLDDQHRQIHRMLVGLFQTLEGGQGRPDLVGRIQQIEAQVSEHFQTEEALMETVGYPHVGPHRVDHAVQVERVQELVQRFLSPEAPPLEDLVEAVHTMLLEHIRMVDLDFARWEQVRRLEMR